ncbi:MAG TPA: beta-ketoacyl synthase chain length factor [Spongiibacteraceae bacterium]|nr:beta-ketoacyl synthase chain length factor [Spongiibacteraceae bacterium]
MNDTTRATARTTVPTTLLGAWIEGVGLLGPGLASWQQLSQIVRGIEPYCAARTLLPAPTLLPPAERRRAVALVKLTLATGLEAVAHAGRDAATLPSIFTSSSGDGQNIHAICETLASSEREISPTRFHNSVHNAAAGYWSIATGATAPSTALCAYDGSFGAGLLEALVWIATEKTPVLLLAYDVDYPAPLHALRPIADAFCTALVLAPERSTNTLGYIDAQLTQAAPTSATLPELEQLRANIPAARCLPLLELLAARRAGSVVLDYLDDCELAVNIQC